RAKQHLLGARPFFKCPELPTLRHTRARFDASSQRPPTPPFDPLQSIFASRRVDTDGQSLYAVETAFLRNLDLDWRRITKKTTFRKLELVAHAAWMRLRAQQACLTAIWGGAGRSGFGQHIQLSCKTWGSDSFDAYLGQIKEGLRKWYEGLCRIFVFYCMAGSTMGEKAFQMSLNQFSAFAKDARIPVEGSRHCRQSDLDTMFISTNYEEEKGTIESETNDDRSLMRFEFVEIVVRMALAKYVKNAEVPELHLAVERLCEETSASMPSEALLDTNEFRRTRLYVEAMHHTVSTNFELLEALYIYYKARSGSKQLRQEDFFQMVTALQLVGSELLSKREVKLAFVWSQLPVVDEINNLRRFTTLTLFDFIEALARMTDVLCPPTEEEITAYAGDEMTASSTTAALRDYYRRVAAGEPDRLRRLSRGFSTPNTRPLVSKFGALVQLLQAHAMGMTNSDNMRDAVKRLLALAKEGF
ncbi:hypothetical protein CYMTET_36334, partial [Cymbomonas tetramitiformis]